MIFLKMVKSSSILKPIMLNKLRALLIFLAQETLAIESNKEILK